MKKFIYAAILILVACGFLFAQPAPIGRVFFWQLLDTPTTYVDQADKILQVNSGESAVEFTSIADIKSSMDIDLVENTALSTWAGTANINTVGTITTGTWQATDVGVAYGGTGASTLTDGGILLGSGTSAVTAMSVLANGSIVVGDGTTDPVALAAFTSSTGDLKHEAGGLEADVSGYTDGLYGMASGVTTDIDTIAEVETAIGGTNVIVSTEIDTFSEINAIVADKTLVNEEDAVTWDALGTFSLGITITTGDPFTLGTNRIDNGSDLLDGEMIADDTIDNDSIDWGDMVDLTTDGALGADVVDEAHIADNGIDSEHYNDGSIDLVHLAAGVYAKDLVTTAPVTGAADNIFVGADSDVTVALDFTASWNFGGAAGFELPNAAAPTTNAAGEIALDTTITDHQPLLQYYDGGENMTVIAIDTAQLPAEDNEIVKYDAATDKFVLEADASAGSTAWDDIADPDNSGLTTITFDNAELTLLTGDNDAAASFLTIQNSDADHTGGNLYLLDLDYSADDGDADADFIKCQDSGGVVFSIQQNGDTVSTGTIQGTTLTGTTSIVGPLFDAAGDEDLDIGSADVDDITLITDGGTFIFDNGLTAAGEDLGSATAEWNDLFLNDGGIIQLGDDQDVQIAHVADTGIQFQIDDKIMFGDTAVYIHSDDDGYLDIEADTGIRMDGPVDMQANALDCDSCTTTLGTVSGAIDAGGATSLEIPNGTDPDVDAVGEIAHDSDSANETSDESIRGYDGAAQFLIARKLKSIQATIANPQDLDDAQRDCCPIWHNNTGMVFTITEIWAWSDTDDTSVNVEVVTATNWTTRNTIDALEIATDGTGVYTVTETTISDATIAHDEIITLDFDDTDDPGVVKINIIGWFNADID